VIAYETNSDVNLAGGIIDIVWFADVEKSAAKDFIRSRMSVTAQCSLKKQHTAGVKF